MNDTRPTQAQDLREAFASIIPMILGLLRAHGVRGLIHLPMLWMISRELRRIAREFTDMFAAWQSGTLSPPATPAPLPAPQQRPAPSAQPVAMPRVPARPASRSPRRRSSQPAPAKPARAGLFERSYPTPNPQNRPGPHADILVTGRST